MSLMTTDILSYVDFCGGITSVYLAQVLQTSISSSCWVFARYIFHVLALVVYHQYLYQVYTLESDRWVLDRPGRILLVFEANQYMCILSVLSAPFFCQYCWGVDGLGVAVVLVCLRSFICRGVYVNCLCLNTSCIVTNGFPFRLPLLHTLDVSSASGRGELLLFWARLVVSPVLTAGFADLIHTTLTDTTLELTCRSQVNFCPSIPSCLRSWTSSTGRSIVELNWFLQLNWFLLTVAMYPLAKFRSECPIYFSVNISYVINDTWYAVLIPSVLVYPMSLMTSTYCPNSFSVSVSYVINDTRHTVLMPTVLVYSISLMIPDVLS